jgi:hypothetical protein
MSAGAIEAHPSYREPHVDPTKYDKAGLRWTPAADTLQVPAWTAERACERDAVPKRCARPGFADPFVREHAH